jgi:hypothetical protein
MRVEPANVDWTLGKAGAGFGPHHFLLLGCLPSHRIAAQWVCIGSNYGTQKPTPGHGVGLGADVSGFLTVRLPAVSR